MLRSALRPTTTLASTLPAGVRSISGGRFPTRPNTLLNFLPNGYEYPIERFGKYIGTRQPGLNFLIPFVDTIHQVDIRELCIRIEPEQAYTSDNVEVTLGGNLFMQFYDSERAVYGASRPIYAASQFAQSVMRTQVGKNELDQLFENRSRINSAVLEEMTTGAEKWGLQVHRFELTDLEPTDKAVAQAMHKQATALREKKETILTSEAHQTRVENEAKAEFFKIKQEADAYRYHQEQKAEGDKALLMAVGEGEAGRMAAIAEQMNQEGGEKVAQMILSQDYFKEFGKVAKESTVTLLPSDPGNVAQMVAVGARAFQSQALVE